METLSIESIIQDVKKDLSENKLEKQAAANAPVEDDINLDDLGLDIATPNRVSESLTKVASQLDQINTLGELEKVAQEAGNSDLSSLIKIADFLSDKIADGIISRLEEKQG